MKSIYILSLCLFFVNASAFAATFVGTSKKVFGNVTILDPGSLKARKLTVNQKIKKDSSILTRDKSFARIILKDKSSINIGPNSKVIIDLSKEKKEDISIVSLLKGKMRTKVIPTKSGKTRKNFIIKTSTAALGVRGTDFSTLYNPENKQTSLITYEGEVSFGQLEKEITLEPKSKTVQEVVKKEDGSVSLEKKIETSIDPLPVKEVNNTITNKNSVIVKAGQFSGTVKNLGVVSKPVKISPVQFKHLYLNEEMQDIDQRRVKKINAQLKNKNINLVQASQDVPPEGVLDVSKKIYAPKAGGFIDLNSALYVAPEDKALFDSKSKTYIPKQTGLIDKYTGDYIPPNGMVLNNTKGFVPKINNKKLIAMSSALNGSLSKTLTLSNDKKQLEVIEYYTLREIFNKNILYFSLIGGDGNSFISNDSNQGTYDIHYRTGGSFELKWFQNAKALWQPFINFSKMSFEKDDLNSNFSQSSDGLYSLGFGLRRFLTNRFYVLSEVSLDQMFFIDSNESLSDNGSRTLRKVTLTNIYAKLGWWAISSLKYKLILEGGLGYGLSKTAGNLIVDSGLSVAMDAKLRYLYSKSLAFEFGIFSRSTERNLTHTVFSATQENDYSGLKLSVLSIF